MKNPSDLSTLPSGLPKEKKVCVVCQTSTLREKLVSPCTKNAGDGYTSLDQNLIRFDNLGLLPDSISLQELNDGSGIEETLRKNNAKGHKTCFSKYSGHAI